MTTVFFYGLFMDADLLREKGLNPGPSRLARVSGYGLRIGERATLEKSAGERVLGSIIELSEAELQILYGEASVADYVAESVVATDGQGRPVDAISYILPVDQLSGRNAAYARSLAGVARKLGLAGEYIREIETWIG